MKLTGFELDRAFAESKKGLLFIAGDEKSRSRHSSRMIGGGDVLWAKTAKWGKK